MRLSASVHLPTRWAQHDGAILAPEVNDGAFPNSGKCRVPRDGSLNLMQRRPRPRWSPSGAPPRRNHRPPVDARTWSRSRATTGLRVRDPRPPPQRSPPGNSPATPRPRSTSRPSGCPGQALRIRHVIRGQRLQPPRRKRPQDIVLPQSRHQPRPGRPHHHDQHHLQGPPPSFPTQPPENHPTTLSDPPRSGGAGRWKAGVFSITAAPHPFALVNLMANRNPGHTAPREFPGTLMSASLKPWLPEDAGPARNCWWH